MYIDVWGSANGLFLFSGMITAVASEGLQRQSNSACLWTSRNDSLAGNLKCKSEHDIALAATREMMTSEMPRTKGNTWRDLQSLIKSQPFTYSPLLHSKFHSTILSEIFLWPWHVCWLSWNIMDWQVSSCGMPGIAVVSFWRAVLQESSPCSLKNQGLGKTGSCRLLKECEREYKLTSHIIFMWNKHISEDIQ